MCTCVCVCVCMGACTLRKSLCPCYEIVVGVFYHLGKMYSLVNLLHLQCISILVFPSDNTQPTKPTTIATTAAAATAVAAMAAASMWNQRCWRQQRQPHKRHRHQNYTWTKLKTVSLFCSRITSHSLALFVVEHRTTVHTHIYMLFMNSAYIVRIQRRWKTVSH